MWALSASTSVATTTNVWVDEWGVSRMIQDLARLVAIIVLIGVMVFILTGMVRYNSPFGWITLLLCDVLGLELETLVTCK